MKANRKFVEDERGQNNTLGAIVSVIMLVIGFAVAGLLFTFTTVLGGQTYELVEDDIDAINTYTSTNHTFTAVNNTWVNLENTSLREGYFNLYNGTGWTDNTSAFTINYTTGLVSLTTDYDDQLNNSVMYAVYQYDDGLIRNAIKRGITSNFEAQEQIGNYMPIIALAIIITVVIGLILNGIASKFMNPAMLGNSNQGYNEIL